MDGKNLCIIRVLMYQLHLIVFLSNDLLNYASLLGSGNIDCIFAYISLYTINAMKVRACVPVRIGVV